MTGERLLVDAVDGDLGLPTPFVIEIRQAEKVDEEDAFEVGREFYCDLTPVA